MAKCERIFKIGCCSASIYSDEVGVNERKARTRSVLFQREYEEKGQIKYDSRMTLVEISQAIRVLMMAQEYVEIHESILPGE